MMSFELAWQVHGISSAKGCLKTAIKMGYHDKILPKAGF
jgi:hypothetical protein